MCPHVYSICIYIYGGLADRLRRAKLSCSIAAIPPGRRAFGEVERRVGRSVVPEQWVSALDGVYMNVDTTVGCINCYGTEVDGSGRVGCETLK